jgi:hypothetical protein
MPQCILCLPYVEENCNFCSCGCHFSLLLLTSRSQWPRCLRGRFMAARLLWLSYRIPPGAWLSVVSVVCCQVEASATGWALVQRSPTECVYVSSWTLDKKVGPGPLEAVAPWGKTIREMCRFERYCNTFLDNCKQLSVINNRLITWIVFCAIKFKYDLIYYLRKLM